MKIELFSKGQLVKMLCDMADLDSTIQCNTTMFNDRPVDMPIDTMINFVDVQYASDVFTCVWCSVEQVYFVNMETI